MERRTAQKRFSTLQKRFRSVLNDDKKHPKWFQEAFEIGKRTPLITVCVRPNDRSRMPKQPFAYAQTQDIILNIKKACKPYSLHAYYQITILLLHLLKVSILDIILRIAARGLLTTLEACATCLLATLIGVAARLTLCTLIHLGAGCLPCGIKGSRPLAAILRMISRMPTLRRLNNGR